MIEPDTRPLLLVHSSDLHVDDDVRPGRYTGNLGLAAVLAAAGAAGADALLLAGDTFDNPRVGDAVLAETAALLAAAPLPVVLLPGNHDPLLPACIFARAGLTRLVHVHVLGLEGAREAVVFPALDLEVRGRAHVGFRNMDPVLPADARAARWQVLMVHGHYVPLAAWAAQAHRSWLVSDAALAESGADCVVLGHWDRAAAVGDGVVPAHYSGSPDLAGTANLIRLCPSSGVTISRLPLAWDVPWSNE